MDDLDLREALRPLARTILPAEQERKNASVRSAFDEAGGVKPGALRQSLPPLAFVWYLPGAVEALANAGAEIDLAGDIRLVRVDVRSKDATSGPCTIRVTANGTEVERSSIAAGQKAGHSTVPGDVAIRRAGEVLRVDILTPGGARDVTVTASYTVAE